jgi:hypothetical protein
MREVEGEGAVGDPQRLRKRTRRHAIGPSLDQQPEQGEAVFLGQRGEGGEGVA